MGAVAAGSGRGGAAARWGEEQVGRGWVLACEESVRGYRLKVSAIRRQWKENSPAAADFTNPLMLAFEPLSC